MTSPDTTRRPHDHPDGSPPRDGSAAREVRRVAERGPGATQVAATALLWLRAELVWSGAYGAAISPF
jgi:hypothetical protein